jgi:MscS family membrane protein
MSTLKTRYGIWLVIIVALVCLANPLNCLAQGDQSLGLVETPTKSESPKQETKEQKDKGLSITSPPEKIAPLETQKIDKAAEKLSKEMEKAGKGVSSVFGKWINKPIFNGITWLKLGITILLLAVVVLCQFFLRSAFKVWRRRIARQREDVQWKIFVVAALESPLALLVWTYGVYASLTPLLANFRQPNGANVVHSVARTTTDLLGTVAMIWFIYRLIAVVDHRTKMWIAREGGPIPPMLVSVMSRVVRLVVVTVAVIMVFRTLTGVDVGPLIASLGLGGLAIALAAKDSVANFFGTMTIIFDKPFQVGERIIIENIDGVVESVGFRSTRLRASSGSSLITIPNQKVINSPITNMDRRPYLQWNANIGLAPSTPPDQIERAVEIIREILDNHEGMQPDLPPRVHFNGFKESSLNIEINAWYHPAAPWDYQAWLQGTCLEIMRRFSGEGIQMASPVSQVYLAGGDDSVIKSSVQDQKSEHISRKSSSPKNEPESGSV